MESRPLIQPKGSHQNYNGGSYGNGSGMNGVHPSSSSGSTHSSVDVAAGNGGNHRNNNRSMFSIDDVLHRQRKLCLIVGVCVLFGVIVMTAIIWHQGKTTVANNNDNDDAAASALFHLNNDSSNDNDDDSHHGDNTIMSSASDSASVGNAQQQPGEIPDGCTTTLLLLRHCEKLGPGAKDEETGDSHCTFLGFQRAAYLATLFGDDNDNETHHHRWPTPSHLFALTYERSHHLNFREFETIYPLSKKIGVEITLARHPDVAQDFFHLLTHGDNNGNLMCGKTVVVSWKHSYLAELAVALGCGTDQGCPKEYPSDDFDQLWQLQYVYHAPTSSLYATEETVQKHAIMPPDIDNNNNEEEEEEHDRHHHHHHHHSRYLRNLKSSHRRKNDEVAVADDDQVPVAKKHGSRGGWTVYGTKNHLNFDPLAFAKQMGDEIGGGKTQGLSWRVTDDEM